ncbi:hypothetical protein CALCODRAFT_507808 [Calocera cornea HHB12733]|uniref:DUF6532 domain-containing protein n=1 Tax=Calocera cornea HHB12733 TaxID=1353952 RepID=A0A165H847_9BASI|nr:hypothetical protein CALCODRAFT_507808 [Calocera cornea HHB12733]
MARYRVCLRPGPRSTSAHGSIDLPRRGLLCRTTPYPQYQSVPTASSPPTIPSPTSSPPPNVVQAPLPVVVPSVISWLGAQASICSALAPSHSVAPELYGGLTLLTPVSSAHQQVDGPHYSNVGEAQSPYILRAVLSALACMVSGPVAVTLPPVNKPRSSAPPAQSSSSVPAAAHQQPPRTLSGPMGYFKRQVANARPETAVLPVTTRTRRPVTAPKPAAYHPRSDDSYHQEDQDDMGEEDDSEIEFTGYNSRPSRAVAKPSKKVLPASGTNVTLSCFCIEQQKTIQDAKVLFRLQYYMIYLYAAKGQKDDFLDTAILLANRDAERRWAERIAKGDERAILGTLQGTARTLAEPLIAHYGQWGRTVLKSVAQSVVKQCYPVVTNFDITDRQRKASITVLLNDNTFLYRDVNVTPGEVKRAWPFRHPAVKAMIIQTWFGRGKQGDGHLYPDLFLPEREPDGIIAAAGAALLFALRQYSTGRYVEATFDNRVFQPEYNGIRKAVEWYKRVHRDLYSDLLPDLLDIAIQTKAAQQVETVTAPKEEAEDNEEDNFLAHDDIDDDTDEL